MIKYTERQLELFVLQELKNAGYPDDSIVTNWRHNNNFFDIVIVDKSTDIPLNDNRMQTYSQSKRFGGCCQ